MNVHMDDVFEKKIRVKTYVPAESKKNLHFPYSNSILPRIN